MLKAAAIIFLLTFELLCVWAVTDSYDRMEKKVACTGNLMVAASSLPKGWNAP